MDNHTAARAFNKTLCQLLGELSRKAPGSVGIEQSLTTLRAASEIVPETAMDLFAGLVSRGGEALLQAYRTRDAGTVLTHLATNFSMLADLPVVWSVLTEADRESVWKYLELLVNLAGVGQ